MEKGTALPAGEKRSSLKVEKKHAITAARQLGYSKNVVFKLETAKSLAEISRIMKDSRQGKIT